MLIRSLVVVSVAILALAGCTDESTASPTPTPTTSASTTILNPDLVPQAIDVVTAETAAVEGNRLADALATLIETETVLNVSDASQVAPATDDLPSYYVVYRTYTLDPSVDPLTLAQAIIAVMQQSGWTQYDSTNEDGVYISALSGGPTDTPWFALIGGDASVAGQSVITFQIASPDLVA